MRITALLLILGFKSFCSEPNYDRARRDLKKVNESYLHSPDFSMDTQYKVYRDHASGSLVESKPGKYICYKGDVYTQVDDIVTVSIAEKLISVNPQNRLISVGDNVKLDFHPLQMNIDSILTLCNSITMKESGDLVTYQLNFTTMEAEVERIDITINRHLLQYRRVVIYYGTPINLKADFYAVEQKPRLEVSYSNQQPVKARPPGLVESVYISSRDGELRSSSKYHDYRIADLRKETRIKTR